MPPSPVVLAEVLERVEPRPHVRHVVAVVLEQLTGSVRALGDVDVEVACEKRTDLADGIAQLALCVGARARPSGVVDQEASDGHQVIHFRCGRESSAEALLQSVHRHRRTSSSGWRRHVVEPVEPSNPATCGALMSGLFLRLTIIAGALLIRSFLSSRFKNG